MKKQQKHFLIAILAGVLLYFLLPEANGLTKAGIAMLSVFLPTIYLWLTCGTSWTSLLSVTVAVLLGTYAGANAYRTLWGNVVCAAIIPFMMVATVLEESGAFEWIVKWIISRKFIHGRPTLFMIMLTLAMIIISIFTAPQVVAVLFFKLLEDVTTSIGYTKEDSFYKSQGLADRLDLSVMRWYSDLGKTVHPDYGCNCSRSGIWQLQRGNVLQVCRSVSVICSCRGNPDGKTVDAAGCI